ncbi:MAG: glycosyltransferase family 2 protein [Candidatus Omnitrophica bacterium]|nr:glycosyltransferase family 2 protein [Candidatus Omnitrophota bacterium]
MIKFNKDFNLKILSLFIAGVFLLTTTGYSIDSGESTLRIPIDKDKDRIKIILHQISNAEGEIGFNLSAVANSTGQIQGEHGLRTVRFKYPVFSNDGYALNVDRVKKVVSTAIVELQTERPDFNIDFIEAIEILPDARITDKLPPKRAEIIEIPLHVISEGKLIDDSEINPSLLTAFKKEILKLLIYHEEGESHGLSSKVLESRDIAYITSFEPKDLKLPSNLNALPVDYHIISPIFNEGDNLEEILQRIKSLGYLHKITFVNDASTDNSREILERWEAEEGIEVLHLEENRKKEGAIREVLEMLEREGRLPNKVILLDSDSFVSPVNKERTLDEMVAQASAYMEKENIKGMAFRMEPLLPDKPSFLQKSQYAEYSSIRFWNRINAKQGQLWVINGPGGIFQADILLDTLRDMVPDFETGDLLITVKMMKNGYKVGYYTDIKVETTVPNTLRALFRQRRRWERGTIKVMWMNKSFYLKQFTKRRILALQTLMHFMMYAGLATAIATAPFNGNAAVEFVEGLGYNYIFWAIVTAAMGISNYGIRKEGMSLKVIKWAFLQGLTYLSIAAPARITGLYEGVKHFVWDRKKNNQMQTIEDISIQKQSYKIHGESI